MNELRIKQNRFKQLWLVLLGLFMVITSIIFIIIDAEISFTIIIVRIAGILGTIIFGACFLYSLKDLLIPKEILIINHLGITDNSTFVSVGFIPWDNINDAYIIKVSHSEFISLDIKNPDILLNNISPWKRKLLKLNSVIRISKINITLQSSDYECLYVLMIIAGYLIDKPKWD